uniref:Uncharacterized protein n=1 Tax=Rhizophora mucronata TaxID=61149 RepID=A0A2P2PGA5_RHIMU
MSVLSKTGEDNSESSGRLFDGDGRWCWSKKIIICPI